MAIDSLFPGAESCKQLKRISNFTLSIGTGMEQKALGQHLQNLKLTYGLSVSHGMKAVGQILFQLCRNILLEIKPDNAKSLFHGRVMQMGESRARIFLGKPVAAVTGQRAGAYGKGARHSLGGDGRAGSPPCYMAARFHTQRRCLGLAPKADFQFVLGNTSGG